MRAGVYFRAMVRRWFPPVMQDWLKRAWDTVRYGGPEWVRLPKGWPPTDGQAKGWADPSIPRSQKAKWPEFVRLIQGVGPLGLAHEAPDLGNEVPYAHHINMAFGYVLARAAGKKDRISLLDWGGGMGHYLILSRALLPDLDLDYCCMDLPSLCEAGREVLPGVQFVSDESQVAGRRYDLVLASGSLGHVRDWKETARFLNSMTETYLYVTRQPIVRRTDSFVGLQRMYAYGYDAESLCWFLNRGEFLECMASLNLELVREFVFAPHPRVWKAAESGEIRGFLFKRKAN